MDLNFTRMVPVKGYEHVVEQIESAICDGRVKPGDRLPSEMKLKDMFNTSRGTVREALRVLEQKGLVSIKTGVKGGATIKEANTEAISDGMAVLIRHQKVTLEQLADFREFLEGYAAERAAVSSVTSLRDELMTLTDTIRSHVASEPDDWQEFHRLDALFHRKVAEMADNPLVLANLVTVHENIQGYFASYLPFTQELLKEDSADLLEIAEAIDRGDPEAAGMAARHHIRKFSMLMAGNR